MDILEALQNSELFGGIRPESIRELSSKGSVVNAAPGETLFLEGEAGTQFYVLLDGAIKLVKSSYDGKEVMVRLIKPGDLFAEVILFENDSYPVSAVAVEQSRVFAVRRAPFLKLLEREEFRNEFIATIMRKQRYLTQRILYLTAYDVEERFFRFLLERYGRCETYEITLSKKEIASAIGTIPETLSRLLQRLKSRRIIQWDDMTLTLKDRFWEDAGFE